MRSCIILHNIIVEDERDGYTQFDVSEFQQREENGSSHVDLTYSTDIPTNIANMMGVRTRIRNRQVHQQLKADLLNIYGVNLDVINITTVVYFTNLCFNVFILKSIF